MHIKATKYYLEKLGVVSIRPIIEKKDLTQKYNEGKTIEVSKEQAKTIIDLAWGEEVNG
jgi:hypothetical protein